jgi:hypothetical protein
LTLTLPLALALADVRGLVLAGLQVLGHCHLDAQVDLLERGQGGGCRSLLLSLLLLLLSLLLKERLLSTPGRGAGCSSAPTAGFTGEAACRPAGATTTRATGAARCARAPDRHGADNGREERRRERRGRSRRRRRGR